MWQACWLAKTESVHSAFLPFIFSGAGNLAQAQQFLWEALTIFTFTSRAVISIFFSWKISSVSSQKSKFFHGKCWFWLKFLESTWAVLLYSPWAIENSLYPLCISLAPLRSRIRAEWYTAFKYLNYYWKHCILHQAASICIDETTDYFCCQFKCVWCLREVLT